MRLPADYVQASTELGYATTVHTAQGVSVDTMHGLASGQESRQQLYTMMTRGRLCNAIYLDVVGDGDPHSVIRPEMIHPLTPTDLLQGILARDTASLSASSLLREQSDPAVRLAQATQRYVDALYVAAEDIVGDEVATALDVAAERTVPGLTEEAAWPTLRAHLMLLGAQGGDPTVQLQAAADARELGSAADKAAVLDWRLDDSGLRNAGRGPLPWVPGIPESLRTSDRWGDYLTQRSRLVETLAAHIHERAVQSTAVPVWGQQGAARLDASCVADVEVWRAAMNVPRQDRRPTGAPQVAKAAVQWQRQLSRRLDGDRTAVVQEWGPVLERISPSIRADRFTPVLAQRLAAMSHAGVDVRNVLLKSAANGTLPDDHAAAALWWRIFRHLSPAVVADIDSHRTLSTAWMPRLDELVGGAERAAALRDSPWWPTLVTTVDHGLQRGWRIEDLIVCPGRDAEDVDACQAMVWRASILMDPVPPEEPEQFYGIFEDQPPEDLSQGAEPPWHTVSAAHRHEPIAPAPLPDHEESRLRAVGETVPRHVGDPFDSDDYVEPDLAVAAMVRNVLGPPEQTQVEIDRMLERTLVRDHSPVPRIRMIHINDLALEYFSAASPTLDRGVDSLCTNGSVETCTAILNSVPARHPKGGPGWCNTCDGTVLPARRCWPPAWPPPRALGT
ncbi:MAG: helicase C-terminal domain-containing protein [Nocardioidaceae bacterium]